MTKEYQENQILKSLLEYYNLNLTAFLNSLGYHGDIETYDPKAFTRTDNSSRDSWFMSICKAAIETAPKPSKIKVILRGPRYSSILQIISARPICYPGAEVGLISNCSTLKGKTFEEMGLNGVAVGSYVLELFLDDCKWDSVMRLLPIPYYHACSSLGRFEEFFSEDDDVPPPLPPEEDGEDIEIDIEDDPFKTDWPEV